MSEVKSSPGCLVMTVSDGSARQQMTSLADFARAICQTSAVKTKKVKRARKQRKRDMARSS